MFCVQQTYLSDHYVELQRFAGDNEHKRCFEWQYKLTGRYYPKHNGSCHPKIVSKCRIIGRYTTSFKQCNQCIKVFPRFLTKKVKSNRCDHQCKQHYEKLRAGCKGHVQLQIARLIQRNPRIEKTQVQVRVREARSKMSAPCVNPQLNTLQVYSQMLLFINRFFELFGTFTDDLPMGILRVVSWERSYYLI